MGIQALPPRPDYLKSQNVIMPIVEHMPKIDNTMSNNFKLVHLPYTRGMSEELRRILKSCNRNVLYNPYNTMQQILIRPQDKAVKENACGVMYNIKCEYMERLKDLENTFHRTPQTE